MEVQRKQNFTRLLSLRDVGIKHFVDSLIIPRLTALQFPLLDMGTGPGFPGIPLKIDFPDERIILAEGVQKRVEFLKQARDQLKLKNLDIVGRNINKSFHLPVMGVVTRAVEDIRNTLNNTSSCLQVGGRAYLMKGPNVGPEIDEALDLWSDYYKLVEDIEYQLPETNHDRRLIIFEKIKSVPISDEPLSKDGEE
jgi:16S rRNA (guanine527-N7)-methyltransferase